MLSKEQLRHIERRLMEERERTLRTLGLYSAMVRGDVDEGESSGPSDPADDGSATLRVEQAALRATREGRYLYRVEEALRRLRAEPERFGRCQVNGRPIEFARLDAVPHARYCIEHKRQMERGVFRAAMP